VTLLGLDAELHAAACAAALLVVGGVHMPLSSKPATYLGCGHMMADRSK